MSPQAWTLPEQWKATRVKTIILEHTGGQNNGCFTAACMADSIQSVRSLKGLLLTPTLLEEETFNSIKQCSTE